MNKLLMKVAGIALGLSLATGIGVAIGGRQAKQAEATSSTATWAISSSTKLDTSVKTGTFTDSEGNTWTWESDKNPGSLQNSSTCQQIGSNGNPATVTFSTSSITDTVTSVAVECASYQAKHTVSITVGGNTYLAATATPQWTTIGSKSGTGSSTGEIVISFTPGGSARAMYIQSITVVHESSGGQQLTPMTAPTLSLSGSVISWTNITGNNGYSYSITGDATKDGNLAADTTSLDVSTLNLGYGNFSITVVTKGDGTSTSNSDASVAQAFTLSEPTITGTFNKHTGTLVSGDYIVTYGSVAMGNVVENSKIQNSSLSFNSGASSITNPVESAVWKITKDGDYWTFYNEAVNKYINGSTSNTNVSLANSVSDNSRWSLTENASTYDFTIKGGSRLLRYYPTNDVWGSYASSNGGALTLYKKYVSYTISYDNNGGAGTMSNSETIVSSCTFTAPSGKEFDHWNTESDDSGITYAAGDAVDSNVTLYAIWRDLQPSVELSNNSISVNVNDSGSSVTVTPANIVNPSYSWSRTSGDDCVTFSDSTSNGINTLNVSAKSGASVTTCTLTVTVNGTIGGNAITPINEELTVLVNRASTLGKPFTIEEAKLSIDRNVNLTNAYVEGVVSRYAGSTPSVTGDGEISYYISSDGSSTNELEVYKGLGLSGAQFESLDDIQPGDSVVVNGALTKYNNTTYEFSAGSSLISLDRPEPLVITYNRNGGSGEMENTTGAAPAVAECSFTAPEGKTFARWNTAADGSGDDFEPGDVASTDLDLYAIWVMEVGKDVIMATGSNSTNAHVVTATKTKDAIKCGTGKAAGVMTMTVKATGVTKIKAYIAGWNNDTNKTVDVTVSSGTISPTSIEVTGDSGISGNGSTFTLTGSETDYKFEFTLTSVPMDAVITLTAANASNNRFVVWGATDQFAETFASAFLSNLVCNANGTSQPTYINDYSWSNLEAIYDNLDEEERGRLANASASESGNDIQKAMARYDYIVGKYLKAQGLTAYNDYIKRNPAPIGAGLAILPTVENEATGAIVTVITLTSVAAVGGFFFLRKRRLFK